jgi:putative ABC transport system permease protein
MAIATSGSSMARSRRRARMWLAISLRSLWRNRRRTLLSVAIIAFGTAISLFVLAFLDNARDQIRDTSVAEYGNLQIAARSLFESETDGYDYLLTPDHVDDIAELLEGVTTYAGSTVQLEFPGLAAYGVRTQVVRIRAVEPENDLLALGTSIVDGRGLRESDVAVVLVGRALAERLSLDVGDVLTVTLTTVDGAYNASPFVIEGIYGFSSEQVESQLLIVPLRFGQLLLNTAGVDRITVGLDRIDDTVPAAEQLAVGLAEAGLALEVRTWEELSPIYRQLSSYFDLLFGFLTLAISVLVFFIILQVLTLAFLERTREIGTLRALGTTRGEVFRLFFSESAWLALFGSGVGLAVGILLSVGFNALGIEWLPPGTVEPSVLATQIGISTMLAPFLVSLFATLLSALYPALQAARLQVVDALRVE